MRTQNRPSWSVAHSSDWRLRLRVRVGRRDLDREISQGACLDRDPLRALRARQLGTLSERWAIAACFANILDASAEIEADPATRLSLNRRAVLAARPEIVGLIEVLRSGATVNVQGVALARVLVEDPTGLLARPRMGQTLQQAVADILRAL